jgi:hypothetical protein
MNITTHRARITGPISYGEDNGRKQSIPIGPCLVECSGGRSTSSRAHRDRAPWHCASKRWMQPRTMGSWCCWTDKQASVLIQSSADCCCARASATGAIYILQANTLI